MRNGPISGFPDPRHPDGSQGVKFREPFMRTFAPCFRVEVASLHLYLLGRKNMFVLEE
jgi:hypothetical protein